MKYSFIFLFAILFILSINNACFSDGGYLPSPGGLISTKEHNGISLEKEKIYFNFYYDKSFNPYFNVSCIYKFKNTLNTNVKVSMAFPVLSKWPHSTPLVIDIKNFTVKENGKIIETKLQDIDTEEGSSNKEIEYSSYYVWQLSFKPGEEKTIENIYDQALQTDEDLIDFRYILYTGASWKGNIKELDIYANFPTADLKTIYLSYPDNKLKGTTNSELNTAHLVYIGGPPIKPIIKNNSIQWTLKNYEPAKNHNICINIAQSHVLVINDINNDNRIEYHTGIVQKFLPLVRWF